MLWIVGLVIAIAVAWQLWRVWASPAQRITNQAARMGWVAAGVDTRDGYRNTKLFRNGIISVVWYKDENVELLDPPGPHRFKDFVELETWLTTQRQPTTHHPPDPK